jgi:CheY-like chemotaxis protein
VEHSEPRRSHVLRLLQRLGMTGVGAVSAADALDALESDPRVRLVLVAARMPEPDGPEITALIRASRDPRVSKVPVYGMVGGTDDDLLDRCRQSGMDGHIGKPVDIGELRRLLEVVLGPEAVA